MPSSLGLLNLSMTPRMTSDGLSVSIVLLSPSSVTVTLPSEQTMLRIGSNPRKVYLPQRCLSSTLSRM